MNHDPDQFYPPPALDEPPPADAPGSPPAAAPDADMHDGRPSPIGDPVLAPDPAPDDAADPVPEPPIQVADPEPVPSPPDAAPVRAIVVVELSGRTDGRATLITQREALIGRDGPDLALALPSDGWVSATHARLSFRDGGWWLEDLQSRNGTWVGDAAERLTAPMRVAPGQIIRLGHTDLTLSDELSLTRDNADDV